MVNDQVEQGSVHVSSAVFQDQGEARIEVLITGNEILEGYWRDEHIQTIAKEARLIGWKVSRFNIVGDHLEELKVTLLEIIERADVCVMTGGLGPTLDDLTIDALSQVADVEAVIDEQTWEAMITRYPTLLQAESTNRRQARLPQGAKHLPNEVGTAPGIHLRVGQCDIFAFPGVPKELHWCIDQHFIPWLRSKSELSHKGSFFQKTLRVALIGESVVAQSIESLRLPKGVSIGYQAMGGEHRIKVMATSQEDLVVACTLIKQQCADHFLNDQDLSLAEQVIQVAKTLKITVGFAESCTGGLLSAALAKIPGASAVFWGSVISYSNQVKHNQLKVPETIFIGYGAVSEPCAEYMAAGCRQALNVDWTVSVTGIAGPGGGSEEKPVGTVCFAWASQSGVDSVRKNFNGDRSQIQSKAVTYALFHLLRRLQSELQ